MAQPYQPGAWSDHADLGVASKKLVRLRRSERIRRCKLLGPLFVLLILWVWAFYAEGAIKGGASGKAFGADFAMFVGAAQVLRDGGNPYDHTLLYRTESTLLNRQRLPITPLKPVVRVGNPPLFFWALKPVAALPFQLTANIWMLSLYFLSGAAFFALLRHMGWRHTILPTMFFMLMPQTIIGPFYGNVVSLVFVGIAFALVAMRRYPWLAGILLTVAWLKPPTALPVVLLIFLFHTHDRRRAIQGFAAATATIVAATLLFMGRQSLVDWIHGLLNYSRDIAIQPDLASFCGLYARDLPAGLRLSIEALSVAIALICTALAWHRYRGTSEVPLASVGWLWALWFLATPYAHFFDEIVLVIPVLAIIGRDARWVTRREPLVAIYMGFASLLLISATPGGIQLLWVPLVAIMLCLYVAGRTQARAVLLPSSAAV